MKAGFSPASKYGCSPFFKDMVMDTLFRTSRTSTDEGHQLAYFLTALHNEPPCKLTTFPLAGWWCLPQIKILKGPARLQLYTFSSQLPLMRAHFQQPFEYISNLIMRLGCHCISPFLFWFIICDFCIWLKSCFFPVGRLRKQCNTHNKEMSTHLFAAILPMLFFWLCYRETTSPIFNHADALGLAFVSNLEKMSSTPEL